MLAARGILKNDCVLVYQIAGTKLGSVEDSGADEKFLVAPEHLKFSNNLIAFTICAC